MDGLDACMSGLAQMRAVMTESLKKQKKENPGAKTFKNPLHCDNNKQPRCICHSEFPDSAFKRPEKGKLGAESQSPLEKLVGTKDVGVKLLYKMVKDLSYLDWLCLQAVSIQFREAMQMLLEERETECATEWMSALLSFEQMLKHPLPGKNRFLLRSTGLKFDRIRYLVALEHHLHARTPRDITTLKDFPCTYRSVKQSGTFHMSVGVSMTFGVMESLTHLEISDCVLDGFFFVNLCHVAKRLETFKLEKVAVAQLPPSNLTAPFTNGTHVRKDFIDTRNREKFMKEQEKMWGEVLSMMEKLKHLTLLDILPFTGMQLLKIPRPQTLQTLEIGGTTLNFGFVGYLLSKTRRLKDLRLRISNLDSAETLDKSVMGVFVWEKAIQKSLTSLRIEWAEPTYKLGEDLECQDFGYCISHLKNLRRVGVLERWKGDEKGFPNSIALAKMDGWKKGDEPTGMNAFNRPTFSTAALSALNQSAWAKNVTHLDISIEYSSECTFQMCFGCFQSLYDLRLKYGQGEVLVPCCYADTSKEGASFFAVMATLPNLTFLKLEAMVHRWFVDLNEFRSFPKLRQLWMNYCRIRRVRENSETEMEAFPPNLEVLILKGARIEGEFKDLLRKSRKLKGFGIFGESLLNSWMDREVSTEGDVLLDVASRCPELRFLGWDCSKFTDRNFMYMQEAPNHKDCRKCVRGMQKVITQCPKLREIVVSKEIASKG